MFWKRIGYFLVDERRGFEKRARNRRGGGKGEEGRAKKKKAKRIRPNSAHSFHFTRGTNSAWTSFLHCRERLVLNSEAEITIKKIVAMPALVVCS